MCVIQNSRSWGRRGKKKPWQTGGTRGLKEISTIHGHCQISQLVIKETDHLVILKE
jgi:hypothetical protein